MPELRTVIDGEHTTAKVMTDELEDSCEEQIREMVNHPAFQNDVSVMPDTHYGAGAVIGFTMPIGDRVVPNTVGVDIGCGMFSVNLGNVHVIETEEHAELLDESIRESVPMGRSVHQRADYHMGEDFPWDRCMETFIEFMRTWVDDDEEVKIGFDGYGLDYFKDVCDRVGYDMNRAINSMGTLGGGNHFIEISKSEKTVEYWATVHSGSRGIGLSIAQYWQERANEFRDVSTIRENIEPWMWDYVKFDEGVSDYDVRQWVYGGKGESFYDMERIRNDFDGPEIEERRQKLQSLKPDTNRNDALDWLEGEEAVGYFIDMIFAQRYASENRKQIAYSVADVLGVEPKEEIESVHNYVDFRDGVIRKGATRAHEGELLIVPFNMRDGTIVCEGKGNPEWNYSAPHGAGRRMSRTQAFNELSLEEFRDTMKGIFSTSVTENTLDEAPMAYKDIAVIERVIDDAAEIIDRWKPVHNIKAEE